MLFNSFVFIFGFLPLSLLLTYVAGRWNRDAAKVALLLVSLVFYAWFRPSQVPLLLGSIAFNYVTGELMMRASAADRPRAAQGLLVAGVLANLAFLGWFKYANFVADNLNLVTGAHIRLGHIALPAAISFFTFLNIAYLIDTARGETKRVGLLDFSLFVTLFPKLIAGPITRFSEIMPQLQTRLFGRLIARNLMVGLVTFSIGMFKKTVIADTLASYVNPIYATAAHGHALSLATAWVAAAGYTLQLYFDFSGYSDMAIGLARMFGLKLPLNFHSPLRAPSIIEYWRRWHMTLQRFIVSYIFQPLSLPLNRVAAHLGLSGWSAFTIGSALPVFITFVAVGFWHGAGWTFGLFGVMHGVYLSLNQAWREVQAQRRRRFKRAGLELGPAKVWQTVLSHVITVIAVIYSQVMFRSDNPSVAVWIWRSMTGFGGANLAPAEGFNGGLAVSLIVAAGLVFLAPNSQQIMGRFDPALNWREWRNTARAPLSWVWKPNFAGLLFAGSVLFLGVMFIQRGRAVFLYFNF